MSNRRSIQTMLVFFLFHVLYFYHIFPAIIENTSYYIKTELVSKLSQFFKAEKNRQAGKKTYLPGNYQNILSFLRLDIDDLRFDYDRDGKLGLMNALDEDLVDNSYKNELIELLNNLTTPS